MFGALGAPDSALPLAEIGFFDCSNGGCSSPVSPTSLSLCVEMSCFALNFADLPSVAYHAHELFG